MASSAFEQAADAIKEEFDLEFAPEHFVLDYDNLHESLGRDGVYAGIAPTEDEAQRDKRLVQSTWVEVRFYDLWTDEIEPTTAIDPRRITQFAERFRDVIRRANDNTAGTSALWFFDVDRIQYPNDPTGNKSRFVATIRCMGNNNNLIETS